jgi:hypothetical protein
VIADGLRVEARGSEQQGPDQGQTDEGQKSLLVEDDSEW